MASLIDAQRFLADLDHLRTIGTFRTGVHRPTYSQDDMRARHWLAERLMALGYRAEIDGIGNVFGWCPGPGKKLLVGSHIESQNEAGWLDGALGVIAGVALARAGLAVDVAAWADEEGHYLGFPGSRSFIGELDEAEIDAASGRYTGTPLRKALADAGLAGRPRVTIPQGRHVGFLEMHIEQGGTLDRAGEQIGVVTGIVAIWQYRIIVTGQQNHAGTTTMAERRDAGAAAVRLLSAIEREYPTVAGPRSVWTAGRITLDPGAASIIPGRAEILFQHRDVEVPVLERMQATLERLVAEENQRGPCQAVVQIVARATPALCDPDFMDALAAAAEEVAPGRWRRMPSGAGHDAQYLARKMPAAMLFVPSINGISHHWSEDTKREDLVAGCEVLARAARAILAKAGS
jgi:N-carbamoyl-L-amino-acid hydrolase